MPKTQAGPTYSSYLKLDSLLDLQSPLSVPEHPDELHFVVTHQAMELWFRVLVQELRLTADALRDERWTGAIRRLRRANGVLDALTSQLETLAELDPQAFLQFRSYLGTASGFQSEQYRVIEVLSGLRTPEYLALLRAHGAGRMPEAVINALRQPSIAELVSQIPTAVCLPGWAAVYTDPSSYGVLFLLAEQLLDYDQRWMQWRYEHLVVVERVLGRQVRGTAGALPSYLEHRVHRRFFPLLWDVRGQLGLPAESDGSARTAGGRAVPDHHERGTWPKPD